ncbi:LamG domain-containing protein [Streptomyces sp. NPDC050508]|uniref:LamG domain-containing protein n=1 Tax=Streptomyces sp. NPDC050508 TaxID=3155405 RepID=UPI003449B46F
MISRRGLLNEAALVGVGAMAGVPHGARVAVADAALDTPFTPVGTPHLAQAEQLVGYQRLLAAGYLVNGLVGHWALDGSGADRSGRGHPVALGSGATWTATRAGGELSLDGTTEAYAATDSTDPEDSVLDTTAPFTVSAWVRLASDADPATMHTAVSQDSTITSRFLLQYDNTASTWAFKVRSTDRATEVSAVAASPAALGVWTHLTGVRDGTQIRLYVDGRLQDSAATTLSWAASGGFSIGRARCDSAPVDHFKGAIDDVRAYARALTADEIALVSGRTARLNNVYQWSPPATLTWGTPDDPASWVARARCASFVTGVLKHTYGWASDDYFLQYFQERGPEAADYCSAFLNGTAGPRFQRVREVADLQPGDIIAVDYAGSDPDNTGHIVMVREVKGVFSGTADFSGETQYAVEIVDCTSDPHGVYALTNYPRYPDTRMVGNVTGENLQGVGIGHMMFYASDTTGEFSRYRWSVNSAKTGGTYDVTARPVAAARVG